MAALSHAESRRLYSWWWDSHISPKNSKWLQENLTDMDTKVKTMIKLIEEDADSFAKRAEMYYKKRPELMKLVEEFYRAYRALAERYDHATGELRQAQRTMVEAFPNQIPFSLTDDSPSPSSEVEPHTPEMPHPIRALLDPINLQNDALGLSSPLHAIKRNGAYSEQNEIGSSKKGLKQLNEVFTEGRVRKGLNFQEEVSKDSRKHEDEDKEDKIRALQEEASKLSREKKEKIRMLQDEISNLSSEKEEKVKALQEEVSKLSIDQEDKVRSLHEAMSKVLSENQDLNSRALLESERASKAEKEVENLLDLLSKLEEEKESANLQHQECLKHALDVEGVLSQAQKDAKRLQEEVVVGATKLAGAEEKCHVLERTTQALQSDKGILELKTLTQEKELVAKDSELDKLGICMKEKQLQLEQAEAALQSMRNVLAESAEEQRKLNLELHLGIRKLEEMEATKKSVKEEVRRISDENDHLTAKNLSSSQLIKILEEETVTLKAAKKALEEEVDIHMSNQSTILEELQHVQEKLNDLNRRHEDVTQQASSVGLNVDNIQSSVKDLKEENLKLKEICKRDEGEKVVLLGKLKELEKLLEVKSLLEISLSDAHIEIDGLQEKLKMSEESLQTIFVEKSNLLAEKNLLLSQIENVKLNIQTLSERNIVLENSLSDVSLELEGFRLKTKSLEESCQSLQDENAGLLMGRENLFFQVESIQAKLEDSEKKIAELDDKQSCVEEEKELLQHQVGELLALLDQTKEDHANFGRLTETKLVDLQNQIIFFREALHLSKREVEKRQEHLLDDEVEIVVLRSCILEMKENNLLLWNRNQKHVEISMSSEKLISELKDQICRLKEKISFLSENNDQLRTGMHQILELLHQESYSQHEVDDQFLLQQILGRINKMQSTLFDAEDEITSLYLEKSVHDSLLEQLGVEGTHLKLERNKFEHELGISDGKLSLLEREKVDLIEVIKQLRADIEALGCRETTLKGEMAVLHSGLLESQKAYQTLSNENVELLEENQSWKKEFCFLRDDKYLLEEEYNIVANEALTLGCLSLVFENFGKEKAADLKELCGKLDALYEIKGVLEKEVDILSQNLKKLDEYRSHSIALEDELREVKSVMEPLRREIKMGETLLGQKAAELLETLKKLEIKDAENIELHQDAVVLKKAFHEANIMTEDLEKKIFSLVEDQNHKHMELVSLHVTKGELEQEIRVLKKEAAELPEMVEYLKLGLQKKTRDAELWELNATEFYIDHQTSACQAAIFEEKTSELIEKYEAKLSGFKTLERDLKSRLQKQDDEMRIWEFEMVELYKELQISYFYTEILREKAYEMVEKYNNLETGSRFQKRMYAEESASRVADIEELKRKVVDLEGQNEELRNGSTSISSVLVSLLDSLSSLENQALMLINSQRSGNQEKKDSELANCQEDMSREAPIKNSDSSKSFEVQEFQKLQAKVQAVENSVVQSQKFSRQERLMASAKLEEALKEIGELKYKNALTMAEVKRCKDISIRPQGEAGPSEHARFQKDEEDICDAKMKDIQLDHVSDTSSYNNGVDSSATGEGVNVETEDQMIALWESQEKDYIFRPISENQRQRTPGSSLEAIECHQIETVEEQKFEKELAVIKQETARRVPEVPRAGSRKTIERLASDARRLTNLQIVVQDLTGKVEQYDKHLSGFEYDSLKAQLKEVEQTILQLVEANVKLTKSAEKESPSPSRKVEGQDERGGSRRRQVSERARRWSEKVGRLEFEVQRIQFGLLKLEDEFGSKASKDVDRRARVLLRDFLYGAREHRRKKKCRFCACVRPPTKED